MAIFIARAGRGVLKSGTSASRSAFFRAVYRGWLGAGPLFQRPGRLAGAFLCVLAIFGRPVECRATQVAFDLPDTIECRDVTPEDFTTAHPTLKVIEAKFRISARVVDGNLTEIVDFLYVLNMPTRPCGCKTTCPTRRSKAPWRKIKSK